LHIICQHGGVVIFVSNLVKSAPIFLGGVTDDDNIKLVGCIIFFGSVKMALLCCYCSPNQSTDLFKLTIKSLRSVCAKYNSSILLGDFNLPMIDWSRALESPLPKPNEFIRFCWDYGMTQINMFKTRGNSVLDFVLTNDPLLISDLKSCIPFGSSDHSSLLLCIICPSVDFCDEQVNSNVVLTGWGSALFVPNLTGILHF